MKMKQVYESNPALGDPMSIQGQLTENGHRLDKLRSELKKFQVCCYLCAWEVETIESNDLPFIFRIFSTSWREKVRKNELKTMSGRH